jgi:hypothetical protein
MDLERLKQRLEGFAKSLKKRDRKLLKVRLNALISAFPFNEYEYTLMFLLDQLLCAFGAVSAPDLNCYPASFTPRAFSRRTCPPCRSLCAIYRGGDISKAPPSFPLTAGKISILSRVKARGFGNRGPGALELLPAR